MFRMPKSARTNCSGDDKVYVECNAETRMFRAVVEGVDNINILKVYPSITINHDKGTRTVSIVFNVSTDDSILKDQAKNFSYLLGSLNEYSFQNNFTLKVVDFFSSQCKRFIQVVLNKSLRDSDERSPQFHEKYDGDNLAF